MRTQIVHKLDFVLELVHGFQIELKQLLELVAHLCQLEVKLLSQTLIKALKRVEKFYRYNLVMDLVKTLIRPVRR